jgi:hypothetical protein
MVIGDDSSPTAVWPLMFEQPIDEIWPTSAIATIGWYPRHPGDIVRAGTNAPGQTSHQLSGMSSQVHECTYS